MNFLENILIAKREEIIRAKSAVSRAQIERLAAARNDMRAFTARLDRPGVQIIAEIKRASPSRGDIRPDLDVATIACSYAAGGAAALSVLTEPLYFKGSAADLRNARQAVTLPVLRKDFIVDPYQVYETVVMGADAMLLIVRILDDRQLETLYGLAVKLGLEVLTEIFDENDATRAMKLGAHLVGINNRDLTRFSTDITQATRLASLLLPETITVALSGINSSADVQQTLNNGIRRFLIGEALICQSNPASTLRDWLNLKANP